MYIPRKVGAGHLAREDLLEGVLLEDHLRDGEVDRLRVVGCVAVLPVRAQHHRFQVIDRQTEPRMVREFSIETAEEKLDVDQFPYS
jgi:hypothetical protein